MRVSKVLSKGSLVFIPGWAADKRCWQELEFLLSGHFECSHIELPYSRAIAPHDSSAELERIARAMPANSVVVAWSLGAMLAVQIAYRYPQKVKSLVVIASNPSFVSRPNWPHAMPLETFANFSKSFDVNPIKTLSRFYQLQAFGYRNRKQMQELLSSLSALEESSFPNAAILLRYLEELDNSEIFFKLPQPVLSILGENDELVPVASHDLVEQNRLEFDACNIKQKIIPECGHAAHISHCSNVFSELVDFLSISDHRYKKDKKKISNSFSSASTSYDASAQFQFDVAKKLCRIGSDLEGKVLDLGCGTGYCCENLSSHSCVDMIFGLDIAQSMLLRARSKLDANEKTQNWCNADLEALPFIDKSMDALVSSLAIQWSEQLAIMFEEAARVLVDCGYFLVSSLGPETLWELNSAWQKADDQYIHVNQFKDANTVMDAASSAGFEVEYFEADYVQLHYARALDLMKDLKAIGAHNLNQGGPKGLTGKQTLANVESNYREFKSEDGSLPATYQVYYWLFKKRK